MKKKIKNKSVYNFLGRVHGHGVNKLPAAARTPFQFVQLSRAQGINHRRCRRRSHRAAHSAAPVIDNIIYARGGRLSNGGKEGKKSLYTHTRTYIGRLERKKKQTTRSIATVGPPEAGDRGT